MKKRNHCLNDNVKNIRKKKAFGFGKTDLGNLVNIRNDLPETVGKRHIA